MGLTVRGLQRLVVRLDHDPMRGHERFHEKATLSRPPWWPLSLLLDRFGCPSLCFHSHSPRALITAGPVHDGIRQGRRCILTHGLPRERARLSCAVAGSGSDR